MIPSRETLFELQEKHKFSARILEIVIRLREMLKSIGEDQFLPGSLVLKGGTALNLCFGSPPRLSVDLDFNYIGAVEVERMREDRPRLIAALERVARRASYRIQSSAEEHAGKRLYLRYASALGGEGTLQLDVNFLHRLPLEATRELPVWNPGEGEIVLTKVVAESELIAGKAVAMLDRVAPRDLYDISILPRQAGSFDVRPEMRAVFIAMAGVLDQSLTRYTMDRFQRLTDNSVQEMLHPLLREGDRPNAKELQDGVARIIGPWLKLSPNEEEYVECLQRGELMPELLFPQDRKMADKLRQHPALLWKAKNAQLVSRRTSQQNSKRKPINS
jgi:predicted nucleotidyltransferase component of viral defense system